MDAMVGLWAQGFKVSSPDAYGRPSKTTDEQKAEIRTLSVQGYSVSDLAKQFKISRASVLNVLQH